MKLIYIITLLFLLATTSTTIIIGVASIEEIEVNLENHIFNHLETAASLDANHVESYISILESKAMDFSSDGKIKECVYDLTHKQAGCTLEQLSSHLIDNKLPLYDYFLEI